MNRRKTCPHARARCVHGDEINFLGGARAVCLDCRSLLDGPVPDICWYTGHPHTDPGVPPMDGCGGCRGEGSHKRWCPQRVGHYASIIGPASEALEAMGDRVGASDPGRANRLYQLSAALYGIAEQAAKDKSSVAVEEHDQGGTT